MQDGNLASSVAASPKIKRLNICYPSICGLPRSNTANTRCQCSCQETNKLQKDILTHAYCLKTGGICASDLTSNDLLGFLPRSLIGLNLPIAPMQLQGRIFDHEPRRQSLPDGSTLQVPNV